MSRALVLGLVLAVASSSGYAQVTVETEGVFTDYSGDARPVGESVGTYVNGVPVLPYIPPVIVNDVVKGRLELPPGTTSVEFEYGEASGTPNIISWTPAVSTVPSAADGSFLFGTFGITNGYFLSEASFGMTFTTASSDPNFDGKTFSDALRYLANERREPADLESADYLYLASHPEMQVVRIEEGSSGTVELWGRVGSLVPLFFANPTGGVQLVDVTPIPEPEVCALMIAGLLGVGAAARRERRRRGG